MSHSANLGQSGLAGRGPHAESGTRTFPTWRWISVWVVAMGWLGFTIAAVSAPAVLDDVWAWAAGLPVQWQLIVWIVLLPWMIGIAVLRTDMPEFARILLIVAAAVVSIWTFAPTSRGG